MRICYLAPAESAHIEKWTKWMAERGHDVHVVSFREGYLPHVSLHCLGIDIDRNQSDLKKLSYLTAASKAKAIIGELKPDVIHAHYASSYGLLASLSCTKEYYLSVWGSDIYEFPKKTVFHRLAIKHALNSATWLMSTSVAMSEEASNYTNKPFIITPFGVDTNLFSSAKRDRSPSDCRFVVGTVKALESYYGIDVLLRGVAELRGRRPDIPIEVRIAGKGSQKQYLEGLAHDLGLSDAVTWLGFIGQDRAAWEWANMDVAIVMSKRESFGVSLVEAQACATPIIYSDIPGLREAAGNGEMGICIPCGDSCLLADWIARLYDDEHLRGLLGETERSFVKDTFDIDSCFSRVEHLYTTNLQHGG